MSNSPLVNYTKISPNSTNPRKDPIKKITIHHMAGNLSVETCGNVFAPASRQASANYGVGTDGRVGLYVDEANRAWTSSNAGNDNQAVTIEVANDQAGGDWHISDIALSSLISLCADICRRNGIPGLIYTGDATGTLTRHNLFAATSCPGPYLQGKFPYIAEKVNEMLAAPVIQVAGQQETAPQVTGFLYRVRIEADDVKSQIGAFAILQNAINRAEENKEQGYKVFEVTGALVYDPNAAPEPESKPEPVPEPSPGLTPVAGQTVATVAQMRAYVAGLNPGAPDLAAIFIEEGAAEGMRGDVAFAQSCLETGNFRFGGDVKPEQNNFAGIGATGGGNPGNSFDTPRIGVRAQIQHLKAYVNGEPLAAECVDPRFRYVERGVAPYVEWLGQKENPQGKGWATGADYGPKILRILDAMLQVEPPEEKAPEQITVDNALADGLITDGDYWLGVLIGAAPPDKAAIKALLDKAHTLISDSPAT